MPYQCDCVHRVEKQEVSDKKITQQQWDEHYRKSQLYATIESLWEEIGELKKIINKKPHKYHVCGGKGFWSEVTDMNIKCGSQCHACEGKGIIWE